ncbi:hypothetical protein [Arthrobacter sp. zg-Y1171]|uniref:hypothetical protein n=1 Tax=Arthrobacter sp. zg-Y1171 TaxID=2964610 RepID=UPI002102E248|nr:hypothetical protein [Arthrobacter sp. zg-Y1171]MCQ1995796.1 hypothetical protein [Arthrobacter sp. zg-Y1171]UWX83123.1 hypothetical protein N2L00_06885 [Arthrobacter sp. zg-Y1171]
MSTLIVTAHPDPGSLTHATAAQLHNLLGEEPTRIVHLAQEGFESFARHGYTQSFSTSAEHGIIDFCGIRRGKTAFIHESESTNKDAVAARMYAATATVAAAINPAGVAA